MKIFKNILLPSFFEKVKSVKSIVVYSVDDIGVGFSDAKNLGNSFWYFKDIKDFKNSEINLKVKSGLFVLFLTYKNLNGVRKNIVSNLYLENGVIKQTSFLNYEYFVNGNFLDIILEYNPVSKFKKHPKFFVEGLEYAPIFKSGDGVLIGDGEYLLSLDDYNKVKFQIKLKENHNCNFSFLTNDDGYSGCLNVNINPFKKDNLKYKDVEINIDDVFDIREESILDFISIKDLSNKICFQNDAVKNDKNSWVVNLKEDIKVINFKYFSGENDKFLENIDVEYSSFNNKKSLESNHKKVYLKHNGDKLKNFKFSNCMKCSNSDNCELFKAYKGKNNSLLNCIR